MLWRREKSLSDIDKVDLLTIHSVEGPGDHHDSADEVCPVPVGLGRSNILPRQSIEPCNVPLRIANYVVPIASALVVVDWEQHDHQHDHQGHEYNDDCPKETNKKVAIESAL